MTPNLIYKMKRISLTSSLAGFAVAWALTFTPMLSAQEPPVADPQVEQPEAPLRELGVPAEAPAPANAAGDEAEAKIELSPADGDASGAEETVSRARRERRSGHSGPSFFSRTLVRSGDFYNEAVAILGNVLVERDGEVDDAAVAILGDTVIDGLVGGDAVAVLGNLTVNGRVNGEAVAILGDSTVNGEVRGELVTVLGRVQLGPEAHIRGNLVSVGGKVDRAPGSRVDGETQEIAFLGDSVDAVEGLKTWVKRCLLLGRPLAFGAHLGWAWGLAFAALACYFLIALLFPKAVVKCAKTLEIRPGLSFVAAILSLLLAPILAIVLSVTVVGPILLGLFLFFASIFGKVVFFAWMGRRITLPLSIQLPAMAVLFGGVITLFIYVIPFVGFIFQKFAGFLGLGVVIYTIILMVQADRAERPKVAKAAGFQASPMVASTATTGPGLAGATDDAGAVPPVPTMASKAAASEDSAEATPDSPLPPPLQSEPPPGRAAVAPEVQFSTLPRAGFWIRCAATLLDIMLIGVVLNVLETRMFSPADYFPLMAAAYFITFWALKGTTIGGVVCGLKVVRLDDRPVDWSVACFRGLGGFLSLFVAGLGFIWVAFDPERQSWHDKIAGTTIVRVPRGVSLI